MRRPSKRWPREAVGELKKNGLGHLWAALQEMEMKAGGRHADVAKILELHLGALRQTRGKPEAVRTAQRAK